MRSVGRKSSYTPHKWEDRREQHNHRVWGRPVGALGWGGRGFVVTSRRSGCPSKTDDGAGDAHQGSSEATLTFKQGRLATRPLKTLLSAASRRGR